MLETDLGGLRVGWRPVVVDDLDDLAAALDREECRVAFDGPIRAAIAAELALLERGEAVLFGPMLDERLLGYAGLLRCPDEPGEVELSTALAPVLWGTGTQGVVKALQWGIAVERLGRSAVLAYVDRANDRSIASLARYWPDHPGEDRGRLVRYRFTHPPVAPPISSELLGIVDAQPGRTMLRAERR